MKSKRQIKAARKKAMNGSCPVKHPDKWMALDSTGTLTCYWCVLDRIKKG